MLNAQGLIPPRGLGALSVAEADLVVFKVLLPSPRAADRPRESRKRPRFR